MNQKNLEKTLRYLKEYCEQKKKNITASIEENKALKMASDSG